MPELPEVEVVRRDLDPVLVGRRVVAVEVERDRAVRRECTPSAFVERLVDRTVASTSRHGKFLVVHLVGGDALDVVVVHLGMSGQLRVGMPGDTCPAHTHVTWVLDDGQEVRFVDPRTFGQMWHDRWTPSSRRAAALAHLGPDAVSDLTDESVLAPRLANRRVAVKARLMDQTAVAGLGNIYTDEILHRAGVAPQRPAGSLSDDDIALVVTATREILRAAIAARGSSLADAQYVDGFGQPGAYQLQHAVHAKHGAACARCGRAIARARIGGRSASWCPGCQR